MRLAEELSVEFASLLFMLDRLAEFGFEGKTARDQVVTKRRLDWLQMRRCNA